MTRDRYAQNGFDSDAWWDEEGFLLGLHTLLDPVRVPYFLSALASVTPSMVLDVGAGGGFVGRALATSGHEVHGIDLSADAVRAARTRVDGAFIVGDAHRLPYGAETFDAVVCSEVLEHVDNPRDVIAEISRVLRTGGRMLFSTPNRTWLSRLVLIQMAQRWASTRILPSDLHEWDRFLTPGETTEMLRDNGLAVERIVGLSIPPGLLPRAIRTWALLRMGRISHAEAGRRIQLSRNSLTAVAYMGQAVKQ